MAELQGRSSDGGPEGRWAGVHERWRRSFGGLAPGRDGGLPYPHPGWVTDEDPAEHALRKERDGFQPPLDIVDGAARVCDPIVSGFSTGRHVYGLFLKDYAPTAW